jgi:hypothetical protein
MDLHKIFAWQMPHICNVKKHWVTAILKTERQRC